jgi:hypothetical protein
MSGNFNIETSVLKFLSFFIKQDTARTFFSKKSTGSILFYKKRWELEDAGFNIKIA